MTGFLYRFAKNYRLMRALAFVIFLASLMLSCRENDSKKNGTVSMQLPKDSSLFTNITWLDSTDRHYGAIPEG